MCREDNVLAQFFWAWAVLYSSPTVATVGLSCTIPLSIVADMLFTNKGVSIAQVVAAGFVVFGFVTLTVKGGGKESRG
eukprot:g18834.t1